MNARDGDGHAGARRQWDERARTRPLLAARRADVRMYATFAYTAHTTVQDSLVVYIDRGDVNGYQ